MVERVAMIYFHLQEVFSRGERNREETGKGGERIASQSLEEMSEVMELAERKQI